jgi:hypothetical protein
VTGADFAAMSKEELIRYVEAAEDLTEFTSWVASGRASGPSAVTVEDPDDSALRVTTVRLPRNIIVELDERFGHTRDGRSGFIRDAVIEKLERTRAGSRSVDG